MADFSPRGTFTALVTPFAPGTLDVDWTAYEQLIAAQIDAGIDGLVCCGTTGESPTLSDAEKSKLVRQTVQLCGGRASVIAGIGANDTRKAVSQAQAAVQAGADALMLVMPPYSRPSQAALVQYVETVTQSVQCPVVLYNVPGRTAVHVEINTLGQILERAPRVIALKDATGSSLYCQEALARFGDRLNVLSGDDAVTLPMMSVGAQGVISVTSNVLPAAVAGVVQSALRGQYDEAREQHLRLLAVHSAMFCAASPGPVKAALAQRGMIQPVLRAPMTMPTQAEVSNIVAALRAFES